MSAATMNGADAVKSTSPAGTVSSSTVGGPKQLKNNINAKSLDGARKQASSPVDGQNRKQQPAKAWQGTNPITQRASTNITNGADKPLPKLPPQTQHTKSTTEAHMDRQAHDRSLFLLAQLTGKDVTVNLKNGEQFTGVFGGGSFEPSKSHYVLKMVRRAKTSSQLQVNGAAGSMSEYIGDGEDHTMTFDIQDTINLSVADVVLASAAKQSNGSTGSSFLTDVQISSRDHHMPRERELQRWEPEPNSSIDMGLEDSGETGWDQFAANEQMYGVQTTYDETIYTTAIDRSNPHYRQRQAAADRIAREIEGSAPANAHIAEERRRDTTRDDGMDEEEKYSGVRRETAPLPKRAAGAYIPPSQRPITGIPTVPGAPFDPAIISTKISHPIPHSVANVERNSVQPQEATAPPGLEQPKSTAETITDVQAPSINTNQVGKKPKEIPPEDYVRGTADAFKQFANSEKLKVKQAQEAKRSSARQEKNVKLNDLKKFAANFKLKSRVPDDLVPILAKDREKQLEIQKKAEEAAKEEELRVKERDTEKASNATSPTPSPGAASHVAPSVPGDTRNSHQHRPRPSQTQIRQQLLPAQNSSPRAPLHPRMYGSGRGLPQTLPHDLRIPPPNSAADAQMSPSSATRFNVNAKSFEFRPGASTFQPSGSSPSPSREPPATFFNESETADVNELSSAYNTFSKLSEADAGDENLKKLFITNGGFPQAYRTPPTWPVAKENDAVTYLKFFPKPHTASSGPSPLPIQNSNVGASHGHQVATHIPGQPMSTPVQRQPYFPPPQPGHAAPFDPRFSHFTGPNGSVQNSPRAQSLGPVFNNQLPGMPIQYPGQQVQGFGMSPSMQYRQLQGPGAPMMMMPGQSPAQLPMRPNFPQGPQFQGPQMGGHMMAHNPSGGYIGGPMSNQGYSPMPPHAQPHMPHLQHAGPAGYSGSPRPPMMQQQGSHQGYQPQMHMQPGFAPPPGQHHPYQMQRGISGQFPQMTPRQQHALPQHPSPGMPGVGAQGDEGK